MPLEPRDLVCKRRRTIGTILVPLDGSPLAEQALPHACRLARATGAGLLLVRATPPVTDPGAGFAAGSSVQYAEAYLAQVRDGLKSKGLEAQSLSLYSNPVPGILLATKISEATLIVMCTHGRTGLRRMVLGSVTEQLVQESKVPVLVINSESCDASPDEPYRSVLVPLDGSAHAEAALAILKNLNLDAQAKVILLRAVSPAVPQFAQGMTEYGTQVRLHTDQRRLEAQQYLDNIAAKFLHGQAHQIQVVVEYPAKAVLAAADDHRADLIVLATRARPDGAPMASTSVPGHLLHNAGTPVLIVRAAESAVAALN